ncbi:trimethylguanosine synthase-like [Triticum dicoccoides]|uniref:trimethylguanosine synthase-like n=1 Tax=Triticum dicoccoides TaxID=85692 RepID=UPI0018905D2E|nr:trimethylguanosine synthase-like [Triticum dicoccoides]
MAATVTTKLREPGRDVDGELSDVPAVRPDPGLGPPLDKAPTHEPVPTAMPPAAESSSMRKLGKLFRLTEVHLWDDFYVKTEDCDATETTDCTGSQTTETRNKAAKTTDEDHSFVEDMELASRMADQTGDDTHPNEQRHQLIYNEALSLSDIPDKELIYISVIATIDEAQHDKNMQNDSPMTEVLEMNQEVHSCPDLANMSNDIARYWNQRYSLFSLFDSGIKMDEEGWFSVTPEPIAKHHASRVGAGILIDCFAGVGGNTIQFATKCKHVVAVDIDPQKIGYAQHNATIYGVNDHIDFIVGDFINIAPHLKGETVFMSPPWGGPDYAKVDVYDIKTMLKPCDGYHLFKLATAIASRVVMFLPRNSDLDQLADMCLSVDPPWAVEVEKNFLNGKLKTITAYFEEHVSTDVEHQ